MSLEELEEIEARRKSEAGDWAISAALRAMNLDLAGAAADYAESWRRDQSRGGCLETAIWLNKLAGKWDSVRGLEEEAAQAPTAPRTSTSEADASARGEVPPARSA